MRGTWLRPFASVLVVLGCSRRAAATTRSRQAAATEARPRPSHHDVAAERHGDADRRPRRRRDRHRQRHRLQGRPDARHQRVRQDGDGDVGAADCDLDHLNTLTVGADGTGTGTTIVTAGPIGNNAHVCTAAGTRCFLSVGELIDSPDAQRADDINLTFTG